MDNPKLKTEAALSAQMTVEVEDVKVFTTLTSESVTVNPNDSYESSAQCDQIDENYLFLDEEDAAKISSAQENEQDPLAIPVEEPKAKLERTSKNKSAGKGIKKACEICGKHVHKSHYAEHVRVHTGVQPYMCEFCKQCFTQRSTYVRHRRRHTGEKPVQCEICQKSFSGNQALQSHIMLHTGVKPYPCDQCSKSFCRRDHLSRHQKQMHGPKSN